MKATGIVHRVDDLGRVVLPREIRKSLNIKEGDLLDIFIENGGVCFIPSRDSLIEEVDRFGEKLSNTFEEDYTKQRKICELMHQISDIIKE